MFRNLKLDATKVYLFIEFAGSAFFSMMFVTTSLYEATVAGLTPVQLILVGTALEISAFVFEVPTGIVADVYSRRLSIIVGLSIKTRRTGKDAGNVQLAGKGCQGVNPAGEL